MLQLNSRKLHKILLHVQELHVRDQIKEPRNKGKLQDLVFAKQKDVVHFNEKKCSKELRNIKSPVLTYLQLLTSSAVKDRVSQ